MKIRKEVVILGVVIVVLSLYLVFNKRDRSLYELPNLKPIPSSDISKMTLESPDGSILMTQKAGEWVINEAAYPGDKNTIKGVADIIANLTLTTLISESKNYERYDLDPDHKIVVKAWKGDELVREFDVGKTASGHRHTFVKLPGDHRVYHAQELFRNKLQGKLDKFRHKTVMSFEPDQIQEIQISTVDEQGTFVLEKTSSATAKPAADGEKLEMEAVKPVWKNASGDVVKDHKLTKLLGDLSALKCSAFIEDRQKDDFKDPIVTISLKGTEEFILYVYQRNKQDGSQHPAVSSQNDYAFYIPKWQADQLLKALADIVPLEKVAKEAAAKEL